MRKLFITVVILLGFFCIPAYAQTFSADITISEIEDFASLLDVGVTDISVEVLYDLNDNPSFLLAEIEPKGFAILFRGYPVISERAVWEDQSNPYGTVSGKKYYAGPMNYIVHDGNRFIDAISGKEANARALSEAKAVTEEAQSKLAYAKPMPQTFAMPGDIRISNENVIHNMGFGRNTGTTCGPIAASILLSYYSIVENKPYVTESLLKPMRDGNYDEGLHKEMQKHFTPFLFGSSMPWTLANGINSYLRASPTRQELMVSASWKLFPLALSSVLDSLNRDRPCLVVTNLITTISADQYARHVMVAYGYRQRTLDYAIIIHTGWWNTGVNPWIKRSDEEISSTWVIGSATIEPGPSRNLVKGNKVSLSTYVRQGGYTSDHIWTSSNEKIAKVDKKGVVKAVGSGTVIITHKHRMTNDTLASWEFNCTIPPSKVILDKLTKGQKILLLDYNGSNGATTQLNATMTPIDVTDRNLIWSSSDTNVLTVDNTGLVTVVGYNKKGATIKVTDSTGKKKASVKFKVAYNPNSISLKNNKAPLATITLEKKSFTSKVEFTPDKKGGLDPNAQKDLKWTSSDESIATVNAKGKVTAKASGMATISAITKNGLTASFQVTVPGSP